MEVEIYEYSGKIEIPKIVRNENHRTTLTFEDLNSGGTVVLEINRLLHKEDFLVSSHSAKNKRSELIDNGFLLRKESLGREYWEKERFYCIADRKINNIQSESIYMMDRRNKLRDKMKSYTLFHRVFRWKKCMNEIIGNV